MRAKERMVCRILYAFNHTRLALSGQSEGGSMLYLSHPMRILGKDVHFSIGRIILWVLGLLLILLVGWFFWRVGVYYWAIRTGKTNPLLSQRLEMSVSKAIANGPIDPEYAKYLVTPTAPSIGSANAALTIVEFMDFDCPYCYAAFSSVRELQTKYGDRVRLVVRNFPLEDIHPTANIAARAGVCAQNQGRFWAYHDKLFTSQDQRTEDQLVRFAVETGMNGGIFRTCLSATETQKRVEQDQKDGLRAGVLGTPTFFLNGTRIPGWGDSETMAFVIQSWLNQLDQQAKNN